MAERAARKVGVTRVADITWLDTIGMPTFQAIRPMSRTVAVSQGKGVTSELAKLSAMMEAIELWHAEQPMTPATTAPARDVAGRLGYDICDLPRSAPSVLHDGLPLDWVVARSLVDGSETLLPKEVVGFSLARKAGWNPPVFFESTNGLASGNTIVEGVLHALYEVIERDAVTAAITGDHECVRVDPRTLGSPVVDELCGKLARARILLDLRSVRSPTELPCFLARITSDDYPPVFQGYGCHLSSEIALTRAIAEAAQARLGYISGARDDLHSNVDTRRSPVATPPDPGETIPKSLAHETLIDDLEDVVKRAAAAFSCAPLVADLTREEIGVPVVRVVAPGSRICPEVF
jgi:ribosomal protein S12 methylthiotransferase accessory factor